MSVRVQEVVEYLESIAPLHLQESYDNSGLLVGAPGQVITGVIISLDCTEAVIYEAISKKCNLVISHHPAIFYGVKRFTGSNATERIIAKAIKNDIALYAIHTNLDNTLSNGVNEQIARKLGLMVEGILRQRIPGGNPMEGAGIVGYFTEPMDEQAFLKLVKEKMKTGAIRHTRLPGKPIERIAVCGGSGSFLIPDAIRANVQVLVTADLKYHQFFDGDDKLILCDIGHYESEQFTVNLLQSLISANFTTFAAHCTDLNTNPVQYFT
jgi:dinuclear metal center YbgI/SA1388 family protein